MSIGKLAVACFAVSVAFGATLAAIVDDRDERIVRAVDMGDRGDDLVRRDDSSEEVIAAEDGGDPGPTGDGDRTNGNHGTNGADNTGDGDRTNGNVGTEGGDNIASHTEDGGTDDGGSGRGTTG